jgi:hypothetical protein
MVEGYKKGGLRRRAYRQARLRLPEHLSRKPVSRRRGSGNGDLCINQADRVKTHSGAAMTQFLVSCPAALVTMIRGATHTYADIS